MAAKKPLVVSSGGVEQIQAADSLDAVNVTSGADPGHTHSIYLKADGTVALTGNLAVDAAVTIDGRDISADGATLDTASGWGDHSVAGYLKADGSVPLTADWTTGAFSIIGSDHWYLRADNAKLHFGLGNDASIYYNGTDLVCDPQVVGSGNFRIPTGRVAIGHASWTPAAKLTIWQTTSDTTALVYTVAANMRYGSAGSGNMNTNLYGCAFSVSTLAAYDGNLTNRVQGLRGAVDHYGSGVMSNAYGVTFFVSIRAGGGNITNAYGLTSEIVNYSGSTGAVTNAYGAYIENINCATTLNYAIYTNAGQVRIGDDLFFAGAGSGLPYAGIYCHDVGLTLTITGTGIANKVQVTQFAVNETSNLMTPDHTNDHITVVKTGVYLVTVSICAASSGGTAYEVAFGCWKNNGATEFENLHVHRELDGGGGDIGSMSISGLVSLTATDTLELWCANMTNTNNVIIESITLSAVMVGG